MQAICDLTSQVHSFIKFKAFSDPGIPVYYLLQMQVLFSRRIVCRWPYYHLQNCNTSAIRADPVFKAQIYTFTDYYPDLITQGTANQLMLTRQNDSVAFSGVWVLFLLHRTGIYINLQIYIRVQQTDYVSHKRSAAVQC